MSIPDPFTKNLAQALGGFSNSLSNLRNFVETVGKFLDAQEIEIFKEERALPIAAMMLRSDPDLQKEANITVEQMEKLEQRVGLRVIRSGESLHFEFENDKVVSEALNAIQWTQTSKSLFRKNVLITLISSVEWFLAQIITAHLREFPSIVETSDKKFTFEELKSFATIEDARNCLIEERVETIMRGPFEDWMKYFKTVLKNQLSYVEPYLDGLVEACQRRNLIIHNGSTVNSIYLAKVAPVLRKGLQRGSEIEVKRDYLLKHIDHFETACSLICLDLWKKLRPTDVSRSQLLTEINYTHICAGRWGVSRELSAFAMADNGNDEEHKLIGRMNYFLCSKRLGKMSEIKDDLAGLDVSAKAKKFQLALFSLLEKSDDFFDIVESALKGGDIESDDLQTFPIFEEMRRDPRLEKIFAESALAADADSKGKKPAKPEQTSNSKRLKPGKKPKSAVTKK